QPRGGGQGGFNQGSQGGGYNAGQQGGYNQGGQQGSYNAPQGGAPDDPWATSGGSQPPF
ncbi:single-stranded DNA-binding protein, partial [Actinomyces sp. 594]|nr:single-stranded DNA-binding protein [Actinomyces sp. 594]